MRCYLRAATGKQGEDVRVDEVELRLNLVAAEVVNGRAILIQDQVLGVRPKPLHPLLVSAVRKHALRGHVDHQGHGGISLSLVPPEGSILTDGLNESFVWTFYHNKSKPRIWRSTDLFRQNLSTLICDAFPVLDSSNDGSNGSCPNWEAQLLCFENQEVSFLQVKLTDESYNQRGVPATRFLGNTGWKALLTFS